MQKVKYPIFASRHSIGLTFLAWSYHWLSGHKHYWHRKFGYIETPANPVSGANAHFFKKNYLSGYKEWSEFILNDKNNLENCSVYGGPGAFGTAEELNQDYASCLKFASEHAPLIFCVESLQDPWYFLHNRTLEPVANSKLSNSDIAAHQTNAQISFIKKYFSDSLAQFGSEVWDLRELVALNFEHFAPDRSYLDAVDRSIEHLYIDARDIWYNGEACMEKIFDYLARPILKSQLPQWRTAYAEWQSIQLKILQFNWYLPTIVDSIVNNYNFDIGFLSMNLLQEGVVQGTLIKEHNLNLKCFGFEKFPSNTKELHKLLIENVHDKNRLC